MPYPKARAQHGNDATDDHLGQHTPVERHLAASRKLSRQIGKKLIAKLHPRSRISLNDGAARI